MPADRQIASGVLFITLRTGALTTGIRARRPGVRSYILAAVVKQSSGRRICAVCHPRRQTVVACVIRLCSRAVHRSQIGRRAVVIRKRMISESQDAIEWTADGCRNDADEKEQNTAQRPHRTDHNAGDNMIRYPSKLRPTEICLARVLSYANHPLRGKLTL